MGASVRARLMAISKERNQTFQLVLTNYHVWVDRCRLRGGDDFWDEINRVLRTVAVKQIVLFSHNTGKPGVKKELAIGEVMRRNLPTRNS
jgi:hypothetical protein